MRALTTAVLVLGALFALPTYASSDVSADRHFALEARRGATTAAPANPSPAPAVHPTKDADCATACPCARAKPSTPSADDRLGGR